ncbi:uncharacterized protein LOC112468573 [Temnothorax curvispinosus]|uniref:Uncharacterized protein LOC112468573 n=1 Tax=Temnothorax curvispinosus TaxID=300111 RepID=A0A6J1RFM7_9HYME|nr:uncharacterized protein LOC112468573 [Temnothorax curvispinosus]
MDSVELSDEWILLANREQRMGELTRRGLSAEGTDTELALRLLRLLRRGGDSESASAVNHPVDTECLQVPAGNTHPDSPSADRIARLSGSPPDHDSLNGTLRDSGHNSAADAYNMMRKWNLKFSGARSEDAETFLLRVEEGRELIPVSDADILRCLPFFLSGIALHWFRGIRDSLTTWAAFREEWRTRFGDPDFQFALRDEIMRRTQGETEPVADFLTCLSSLYDRLSPPWREEEKVGYAHRHLLPRLQTLIPRDAVTNMKALERWATRAETSCRAAQTYRAPPPPEQSLFPDLAYRVAKGANRRSGGNSRDTVAALGTSTANSMLC